MNQAIEDALSYLEGDHVQQNKHRLGVLGSMAIDSAIRILKQESRGDSSDGMSHE